MKNMIKTNNTNIKEETTMETKTRKSSRKFISTIASVLAAATMITGFSAFSASADTNANYKHDGESGSNYVNAVGKHPGEAGFNFDFSDTAVKENGKHDGESGSNVQSTYDARSRQSEQKADRLPEG